MQPAENNSAGSGEGKSLWANVDNGDYVGRKIVPFPGLVLRDEAGEEAAPAADAAPATDDTAQYDSCIQTLVFAPVERAIQTLAWSGQRIQTFVQICMSGAGWVVVAGGRIVGFAHEFGRRIWGRLARNAEIEYVHPKPITKRPARVEDSESYEVEAAVTEPAIATGAAGAAQPARDDGHIHGISGLFLIMERAKKAAPRVARAFPVVTMATFAIVSVIVAAGIILGISAAFPQTPAIFQVLISLLPSALLAAGVAHLSGNFVIYHLSGLNRTERRSLALHLPWNRTPVDWPVYYRRWVYCGDWLVNDLSGDLLPYVRAFVTGGMPASIEEELRIWSCFMQDSRRHLDFEIGHSVRELACVENLPGWTREITPGMNLPELEKALGRVGHEWAVSLLRRAATRKRVFSRVDFAGDLSEALFEFHYSKFEDGREGLMVIIRPHLCEPVRIEESFSDVA